MTEGSANELPLTLTYLDMPGLAEPIRMALRLGEIDFVDRRVGYEEIGRMREAGG